MYEILAQKWSKKVKLHCEKYIWLIVIFANEFIIINIVLPLCLEDFLHDYFGFMLVNIGIKFQVKITSSLPKIASGLSFILTKSSHEKQKVRLAKWSKAQGEE